MTEREKIYKEKTDTVKEKSKILYEIVKKHGVKVSNEHIGEMMRKLEENKKEVMEMSDTEFETFTKQADLCISIINFLIESVKSEPVKPVKPAGNPVAIKNSIEKAAVEKAIDVDITLKGLVDELNGIYEGYTRVSGNTTNINPETEDKISELIERIEMAVFYMDQLPKDRLKKAVGDVNKYEKYLLSIRAMIAANVVQIQKAKDYYYKYAK